ncbi:uncharacterized protein NPIL_18431 [Nephila pilipes]|uniref:Uncharacterized protein n=1 Tax=Nephila pilipes TaxID=299642 RepID=A0A8X6TS58_NEPPI|nr:uncharacterized protein NPIL_18431 [Nephila pilipes]
MDAFPAAPSVDRAACPWCSDKTDGPCGPAGQKAQYFYQEPKNNQYFVSFSSPPTLFQKKTLMDNFKRTIHEAQIENRFDPDAIQWEKISQAFMRNPDRTLKNADKRMGFQFNNMFIVKSFFTFGLRKVDPGTIHLIQTTNVPVLIYELPPSSRRSQAEPNLYRRSFEPYDQMLYHRTVMEPHTSYPIPAGTQYILMTVQKTVFALDVLPETILTTLLQNGFRLGDFRKAKHYHQKAYKLPPPTPAHTPVEERPASGKRPLAKNYLEVPSRYKKIRIAPATRRIQRPPTPEPATSVFVPPPAPVFVSPPAPVFVSPPAPVFVSPPAPVAVSPPAPVVVSPPAPVMVSPPAPMTVSPPAPVVVSPPPPETLAPVAAPVLPEPTLTDNETYNELMDAVFAPVLSSKLRSSLLLALHMRVSLAILRSSK